MSQSSEVILKAERNILGKNSMLEEMNLDDDADDEMDFDNLKNIQHSFSAASLQTPSGDIFGGLDNEALENADIRKDEVAVIIQADRNAPELETTMDKQEGIPLWASASSEDMVIEHISPFPEFASGGNSPTLQLFCQAIQKRGMSFMSHSLETREQLFPT